MRSRRDLLAHAGLIGVGLLSLPGSARAEAAAPLVFTAYRNDSWFGAHKVTFAEEADARLTVEIEIAFDYKLAFVPLYRYRHRNREVWQDGRLIELDTETDDNGTPFRVLAKASGDRLLVDGSGGKLDLPGTAFTTSYWNEATIERGEWLDTQNGKLVRSKVSVGEPEPVLVAGNRIDARPYQLEGDINCTLWYQDGRWVKLRFIASDESVIDYVIEPRDQNG